MRVRRAVVVLAAAAVAGCSAAPSSTTPSPTGSSMPSTSAAGTAGSQPGTSAPAGGTSPAASGTSGAGTATSATGTPSETAPGTPSMEQLFTMAYDGGNLTLGKEGGSTGAYRQHYVTYTGNGMRISGRINIPRGEGPFPAVVLAHGYVPIEEYTNGETMLRERDHLARRGYVALHIDYRNHADSTDDPDNAGSMRLGYVIDAINAGLALKGADFVDTNRIGIVGRSMGGGVVYQALVAQPGLFRAGVAYAPVSSLTAENFNHFIRGDGADNPAVAQVLDTLGTPEDNPQAWTRLSARPYFARVTEPIMIHHGTADEQCPLGWAHATVAALEAAGKTVVYHEYPGERHTMVEQWPLSIRRTTAFLDQHLGVTR